jgi:hypothetical protein
VPCAPHVTAGRGLTTEDADKHRKRRLKDFHHPLCWRHGEHGGVKVTGGTPPGGPMLRHCRARPYRRASPRNAAPERRGETTERFPPRAICAHSSVVPISSDQRRSVATASATRHAPPCGSAPSQGDSLSSGICAHLCDLSFSLSGVPVSADESICGCSLSESSRRDVDYASHRSRSRAATATISSAPDGFTI